MLQSVCSFSLKFSSSISPDHPVASLQLVYLDSGIQAFPASCDSKAFITTQA